MSSRMDTLSFQVDLWNARGDMPGENFQHARRAVRRLLDMVPDRCLDDVHDYLA